MPIKPADEAPSVYDVLDGGAAADEPLPHQASPGPHTGRKTVLQPLTSRVQGARSPHRGVRLAMYGVLVVIALLTLAQAWRGDRAEAVRRIDAEIIQIAADQNTLSQRIGTQALMLVARGLDAQEARTALANTLAQAQSQAERLEELIRVQAGLKNQAAQALMRVAEVRAASRARLWASVQTVLGREDKPTAPGLQGSVRDLLVSLDANLMVNQALVQEVQQAAQQRSEAAERNIKLQMAVSLALLLGLGVAVVEPTARRVRRQHHALTRQALRLKRLALVAERSSNAVLLADASLMVVWVNEAYVQLMGSGPEQALGQRLSHLLQSRSADPQAFAEFGRAAKGGVGLKREIKILTTSGKTSWALVDMQPILDDAGALSGWVLIASDLTEARVQQQMLTLAVEGAGLGTWQWNIETGRIQCNTRMLEMIGVEAFEVDVTSDFWVDRIHPDDREQWFASSRAHLANPALAHRMSLRMRHSNGRWVWLMAAGKVVDRSETGRAVHMAGVVMDVHAQKLMEQQLRTAARTDSLTQLPNRTVMLDAIGGAINRRREQPGYHFAVLFLDFDRFKQVNDTLGHTAGDNLLRQIAQRLHEGLRPGDSMMHASDFAHIAARIGGDEFVVLLDDLRGDLDAEVVADRLIDMMAAPYLIDTHKVISTVSIGVVTSSHATDDADGVMRDADIAMYEAKRGGRARYVVFDPTMRQQVTASAALESDLRQALERNELFVVYQPLVSMAGGAFTGAEALLRWRHPVRGMVSPVEFIPVAESCGLIGALGQFVLQTACRAFAEMAFKPQGGHTPTLAVNLSRAQLLQAAMVTDVQDALRANDLLPTQLILEVTESLAAQDAVVLSTLHGIRALGVALSLDDFGTGYSSLSCLHELPVNFVKVDRSFVSRAQDSAYHRVLIEATIRMAQTLGLGTVAEGIETQDQADLMAQLGCDKGQGYLYGKPMEGPDLVAWVAARQAVTAGSA
jgi:diguanylate cyclase (GGDEF)-like protein/PAS domain S-box-containing protein